MTQTGAWHPDPVGEGSWRLWDGQAWTGQVAPARQVPELTPVASTVGRSLKLDQEYGSGTDVLRCDDTMVGLMHKPFVGELIGEVSTGAWRFDREGVITGKARVQVEPSRHEIGLFTWDGIGTGTDGTLQFADGRWFRLLRAEKLQTTKLTFDTRVPTDGAWVWHGADNVPLVVPRLTWPEPEKKTKKVFGKEIEYTSSSWKSGTGRTTSDIWVDVLPPAANLRELPLLVLLGTFLVWWTVTMRENVWRD